MNTNILLLLIIGIAFTGAQQPLSPITPLSSGTAPSSVRFNANEFVPAATSVSSSTTTVDVQPIQPSLGGFDPDMRIPRFNNRRLGDLPRNLQVEVINALIANGIRGSRVGSSVSSVSVGGTRGIDSAFTGTGLTRGGGIDFTNRGFRVDGSRGGRFGVNTFTATGPRGGGVGGRRFFGNDRFGDRFSTTRFGRIPATGGTVDFSGRLRPAVRPGSSIGTLPQSGILGGLGDNTENLFLDPIDGRRLLVRPRAVVNNIATRRTTGGDAAIRGGVPTTLRRTRVTGTVPSTTFTGNFPGARISPFPFSASSTVDTQPININTLEPLPAIDPRFNLPPPPFDRFPRRRFNFPPAFNMGRPGMRRGPPVNLGPQPPLPAGMSPPLPTNVAPSLTPGATPNNQASEREQNKEAVNFDTQIENFIRRKSSEVDQRFRELDSLDSARWRARNVDKSTIQGDQNIGSIVRSHNNHEMLKDNTLKPDAVNTIQDNIRDTGDRLQHNRDTRQREVQQILMGPMPEEDTGNVLTFDSVDPSMFQSLGGPGLDTPADIRSLALPRATIDTLPVADIPTLRGGSRININLRPLRPATTFGTNLGTQPSISSRSFGVGRDRNVDIDIGIPGVQTLPAVIDVPETRATIDSTRVFPAQPRTEATRTVTSDQGFSTGNGFTTGSATRTSTSVDIGTRIDPRDNTLEAGVGLDLGGASTKRTTTTTVKRIGVDGVSDVDRFGRKVTRTTTTTTRRLAEAGITGESAASIEKQLNAIEQQLVAAAGVDRPVFAVIPMNEKANQADFNEFLRNMSNANSVNIIDRSSSSRSGTVTSTSTGAGIGGDVSFGGSVDTFNTDGGSTSGGTTMTRTVTTRTSSSTVGGGTGGSIDGSFAGTSGGTAGGGSSFTSTTSRRGFTSTSTGGSGLGTGSVDLSAGGSVDLTGGLDSSVGGDFGSTVDSSSGGSTSTTITRSSSSSSSSSSFNMAGDGADFGVSSDLGGGTDTMPGTFSASMDSSFSTDMPPDPLSI